MTLRVFAEFGSGSWMPGSSPGMTSFISLRKQLVIAGLDPAIHGPRQVLRELA
jgi:hypothetical protein